MSDAIIRVSNQLSAGVKAEVAVLDGLREHQNLLRAAESAEHYWKSGISLAPYQYATIFSDLPAGSKILDVGVGFGQSSVFLATLGHRVFAVEPSMAMCTLLSDASSRFSLSITVIQGVGEDLSRIGITDFDVVAFNSSLHHCDDPVGAIAEAFKCLKRGGQMVLVNENMLKPWTTQRRYKRLLEIDPLAMGHYGGNEHSYHNYDYVRMIKSSFVDVTLLIPRMDSALDELGMLLARKIDDKRVYNSNVSVLLRFVFYILKEKLRRLPRVYKFLAKLSIVPAHFRSYK